MATSAAQLLLSCCCFLLITCAIIPQAFAQSSSPNCATQTFSQNRLYSLCSSLPDLGATLHWTYHPENGTADIAYWIPQDTSGWAAWAINPTQNQMNGSNAFLAFHNSTTGAVTVITTIISFAGQSYNPTIQDESLSFQVYSKEAEYSSGAYVIYATIDLPNNSTTQNTVWQEGTTFTNGLPFGHPTTGDHLQSFSSLNFLSGGVSSSGSDARQQRKNIHGMLNAISWGILLPLGVMMARYLKVFKCADPAWFYLHIGFQCSGYILGISGWALGLQLGSTGVTYQPHKNLGISLFCLATLQVFALFLRPDKKNKYRIYWNIYHHSVGYSVIVLAIVNIFYGFSILQPATGWKTAYITIISLLGGLALALEVITWVIVLRRRSETSEKPYHGETNNGYGARQIPMQGV